MSQPLTALGQHSVIDALPAEEASRLREILGTSKDVTVLVDGTAQRLSDQATAAVLELLARLSQGDGVELSSTHAWLNTSQAARLAGISQTYLRNMTDAGEIAVSYRGTHRRFLAKDILAWVKARDKAREASEASSKAQGEPTGN